MFIKLGRNIFNLDNVTEIYEEMNGSFTVYFNTQDGDGQAHKKITSDEYEKLTRTLDLQGMIRRP